MTSILQVGALEIVETGFPHFFKIKGLGLDGSP